MKRKLSNRQVTYLGVFIGLLISGGIFGLWSAVRHINDEELRAQEAKDSARIEYREHLAEEVAKEQALQDSIKTYQDIHSPAVIAKRMQIILAEELKHAGKRPYFDKYRTASFKTELEEVSAFDKEPREVKPEMTFLDNPFYKLIPAKMIRDLIIKRIYYVTNEKARVDVRYLVKCTDKIKEGETERDTTYFERKTATYKLVYEDGEWMVDDRLVDFLSEREAFGRYMDGEYFIDPVEEPTDSLALDSISESIMPAILKTEKKTKQADAKKKDEHKKEVKQKEEPKKNNTQKKDEKKPDTKKANDKKTDTKKASDKKADTKNTSDKKTDTKKASDKKKDEPKTKSDSKQKSAQKK